MGISITTKFHGPSNVRGARVSATLSDYGSDTELRSREKGKPGRLMLSWDHRHGAEDNHRLAAFALAESLGWDGDWQGGEALGGAGYVFVRVGGPTFTVVSEPTDVCAASPLPVDAVA